ncbi:hypothetical protein EV126DRAFT_53835 [Verticillium dahliae]|nr:hypothetical protein EV126DRAFT_53835 [Verticillium dahliae]
MRPETRRDRLCVLRLAPSQSAKVQRVTERRSSAWSVEEWVPGFGSMPAMSQTSGPTRTVRLLFIVANLTAAGNGKDTSLQLQRIPASSCGGILPAGTKQQSFEWPVASTSSSGWDTFIESNDAPSISRRLTGKQGHGAARCGCIAGRIRSQACHDENRITPKRTVPSDLGISELPSLRRTSPEKMMTVGIPSSRCQEAFQTCHRPVRPVNPRRRLLLRRGLFGLKRWARGGGVGRINSFNQRMAWAEAPDGSGSC